jgi:hypothetical protein
MDGRLEPAARGAVVVAGRDRVCYNHRAMRARVTLTVLAFFAALAATQTPPPAAVAAAAAGRAQTLGGEVERTPYVASHRNTLQLGIARAASARPGPWKLPPHALTSGFDASPALARVSAPAPAVARAPIAPPAAPRSCRGPPQA